MQLPAQRRAAFPQKCRTRICPQLQRHPTPLHLDACHGQRVQPPRTPPINANAGNGVDCGEQCQETRQPRAATTPPTSLCLLACKTPRRQQLNRRVLPCRVCQFGYRMSEYTAPWLFHDPVVDGTGRRLVGAGDAPIHKHDMSVTYRSPSWVSGLDQNSTRYARRVGAALLRSSLSSCRPCRNCKCFCPSPPYWLERRPHFLHFDSRHADFDGFKRGRPSSRSTAS